MRALKIGTAGVRGTIGGPFTVELAISFAQAFATYVQGGKILVSRDTRRSGEMIASGVISGLLASGANVEYLGISPTPTLQLLVRKRNANGGIAITGGHNPEHWNALKFIRPDGIYLNQKQGEELLEVYHQGEFKKAKWRSIRPLKFLEDAEADHIEILLGSFDIDAIRKQRFRVAVDCSNGASSKLTPKLLKAAGCDVVVIHDKIKTPFPHEPQPNPQNMQALAALTKAVCADIGFAHDADGERLGIVDEKGKAWSEEHTFAFCAYARLLDKPGTIITNVATSMMVDEIAKKRKSKVIRVPIGQSFISEALIKYNGVIGGEGSGGVALPEILPSHDSHSAIMLILDFLAKTGMKASEVLELLPETYMIKRKYHMEPRVAYTFLRNLRRRLEHKKEKGDTDFTDGILIKEKHGWIHFRASGTEPVLRVFIEGNTIESSRRLSKEADRLLQEGGIFA